MDGPIPFITLKIVIEVLIGTNNWDRRRRTCEGYFANYVRPILYFGFILDLHVLGLKTKALLYKKQSRWCILAKKPQNVGPICLPKPKSLGFLNKSSLWVSVVRDWDEENYSKVRTF